MELSYRIPRRKCESIFRRTRFNVRIIIMTYSMMALSWKYALATVVNGSSKFRRKLSTPAPVDWSNLSLVVAFAIASVKTLATITSARVSCRGSIRSREGSGKLKIRQGVRNFACNSRRARAAIRPQRITFRVFLI